MLAVKLICVGKMREKFYIDAFSEYSKRLGAYCRFECVELAETRLPDAPSPKEIGNALDKEAAEIIKNIPQDAYLAAMCVEGIQMASEELAELVTRRALSGRSKLCFVIGGVVRHIAEREKARGYPPEHVEDDLPTPSRARDACRADIQSLQDKRRLALP